MLPRLIVNADDFGLTRGINLAIAELHAVGVLPSASLMATGPAFQHAVELAHRNPALGVGCHIVLTDGTPVSPPESIPTLLGEDGRGFRPTLNEFLRAALTGKINSNELQREITAQIQVLQRAGIRVTHLDTHKHTHVLPGIARPLLAAAEDLGVRAVRNPFEEPWSVRLGQTRALRWMAVAATRLFHRRFLALPQFRSRAVHTTGGTIGISATGHLNRDTLRQIIAAVPRGTWELVCHPGYSDRDLESIQTRLRDSREIERKALLTVLRAPRPGEDKQPQPQPLQLINYAELVDGARDPEVKNLVQRALANTRSEP